MKIWNWTDNLLATPRRRQLFLSVLLNLFWLWQTVWLVFFFWNLMHVRSYDALLAFSGTLESYEPSLFVRMATTLIQSGSVSVASLLACLGAPGFGGWLFLALSVVYMCGCGRRSRTRLALLAEIILAVLLLLVIALGFASSSLSVLIRLLSAGGMALFIDQAALLVLLLWMLPEQLYRYVRSLQEAPFPKAAPLERKDQPARRKAFLKSLRQSRRSEERTENNEHAAS